MRHYTLNGHEPVLIWDFLKDEFPAREKLLEWADAFEKLDHIVARGYPGPGIAVCTDFLGLAMNLEGPPMVFETVVFIRRSDKEPGLDGRGSAEIIGRTATWEEAEQMHAATMEKLARATQS